MAFTKGRRVVGAATALVGAGAAALVMAAPASAAVTSLQITTPSGYGSVADRYGVGCEYDVEVTINNARPRSDVSYIAQGPDGKASNVGTKKASGTTATFEFKPTVPGEYTLQARQIDNVNDQNQETWVEKKVQVGRAIATPDTGSVELPFSDSCIILAP
ncbi:hypothetical protein [Gordonia sp. SL306]|uniref:hypothetical protein n=1 Tax=Gordonia sp. SL306 TaxID=2995145 RepID=UPI00226EA27D|nr:hypothetical protein [Gordonia sp. SL306]WAC55736.1 hypothetical protein OVA31_00160 [Gordonia sp. SL306]